VLFATYDFQLVFNVAVTSRGEPNAVRVESATVQLLELNLLAY
jgi:hypothetical protein